MTNPARTEGNVWREEKPQGGWWSRLRRGCRKLLWRRDWQELLGDDWAERIFDLPVTDRYFAKQGRSIGRLILSAGDGVVREGEAPAEPILSPMTPGSAGASPSHADAPRLSVYLKRRESVSWWRRLLASLLPRLAWTSGWQEARHLLWAKRQNIPVPEVVAVGEYVGPGGKMRGFLAVEELVDMLPLHEAVPLAARRLDPHTFAKWKRDLAAEMARLTRLLHDRHHFHKDLYLCHFYLPEQDCSRLPLWRGRLHMIDFHRLGHHPLARLWWQIKDLGQLLYSSRIEGVTPRDRLRFWRAYIAPARRRSLLARLIRLRGGWYEQHNQKRKEAKPSQASRAA
ncbi:MAG: lipopolysaccharide kinase InaA family protein [Gemmataceae bacterium]